jgi:hypothetical protein
VGFANLASSLGSITYRWADLNSDGFAQANEVNTAVQLSSSNPVSANRLDPNLEAPATQSIVFGRQGYPFPIYRSQALGSDTLNVLVSPQIDTFRYPNVWVADIRLAREFKFQAVKVRLMGDVFNLLNANTELVRINNVGSSSFNAMTSNMTPRILRLGFVISF